MAGSDPRTVARLFASALDRCEFAEAGDYLAAECRYQTGHDELVGRETILASYSENAEWASRVLERVVYESAVEASTEASATVLYTDRISQSGLTHQYRCRQHMWVNEAGKIARIVHEELPGERERLDEFLRRCGISAVRSGDSE